MNKVRSQISDLEGKPKDISQNMMQKGKQIECMWGKLSHKRWRTSTIYLIEVLQEGKQRGQRNQRNNKEKIPYT